MEDGVGDISLDDDENGPTEHVDDANAMGEFPKSVANSYQI